MSTPDQPIWYYDQQFEEPVPDADALLPPPEATAAAAPPQETQTALPKDFVPLDERTGVVFDAVLPPPTEEEFAAAVGEAAGHDEPGADADGEKDPGEDTQLPPSGTDEQAATPPAASGGDQGGDGGSGEPPDRASGEEGDDDGRDEAIARVQRNCFDNANFFRETIFPDHLTDEDKRIVNAAAIDLAAASSGDTALVPAYNTELIDPTIEEVVAKQFVQIDGGDEDTREALKESLAMEGKHAHLWRSSGYIPHEDHTSGDTLWGDLEQEKDTPAVPDQPALSAAIEQCDQRGISPTPWIKAATSGLDGYKVRGDEVAVLQLRCSNRLISDNGTYPDKSTELAANRRIMRLDGPAIIANGAVVLGAATYPAVQEYVMERYLNRHEDNIQRLRNGDVTALATAKSLADDMLALRNNATLDPMYLDDLRHFAHATAQIVQEAEARQQITSEDAAYIYQRLAVYSVAMTARHGTPPAETADLCDQYALHLYDPMALGQLEKEAALQYMKQGNLASVIHMAEHCPTPETYAATLQACWEQTNSNVQLAALIPHPARWPGVEGHRLHKFAIAKQAEHPLIITRHIDEIVDNLGTRLDINQEMQVVGVLVERLAKSSQARAELLSFDMLTRLHARGEQPAISHMQPFYDVLAKSKDSEYLNAVLGSILTAEGTPAERLRACAKLAKALAVQRSGSDQS